MTLNAQFFSSNLEQVDKDLFDSISNEPKFTTNFYYLSGPQIWQQWSAQHDTPSSF